MGAGQNTWRPTAPARRTSANQAALTEGMPYTLEPGRGAEPVGHLGLDHDQPALERRQQRQQVDQDRHRDVVRQVGDQRGGRRPGKLGDPQGVGGHDLEPVGDVGGAVGHGGRQPGGEPLVDLDRDDACADIEQREGQRPQPGPDLHDHVVGSDARLADDAPHGVRVDDEVLSALLGGPQVELSGQRTDLRRPEQSRAGGGHGGQSSSHPSLSSPARSRRSHGTVAEPPVAGRAGRAPASPCRDPVTRHRRSRDSRPWPTSRLDHGKGLSGGARGPPSSAARRRTRPRRRGAWSRWRSGSRGSAGWAGRCRRTRARCPARTGGRRSSRCRC